MKMFNLTFDPSRHHYAFGVHDRVTVDGVPYTVDGHSRNERGLVLTMDDGSGRCRAFTHQELSRLGSMGKIRVEANHYAPETAKRRLADGGVLLSELPENAAARVTKKSAYVEAFLEMECEGKIKRTDASIDASRHELRGRAMAYVDRLIGGLSVAHSQDLNETPSARTLRRWLGQHRSLGMSGLVDTMSRRGNRNRLMGPEELALMMEEVHRYADANRPTVKNIHHNVQRAFESRNEDREARGEPPYRVPSYETVRRTIHMLEPFAVTVAREGAEEARKKFMPTGGGLRLTRPLERVEIDENTIDIISLASAAALMGLLTEEDRMRLGLNKEKVRWFLTVAICATTRCILGMSFSRSAREQASLQVLQMILHDKGEWAGAARSNGSWDMLGTPVLIVTDNGTAFKSQRFRVACADLGISAIRAPAGLPQMRARNERFFHSLKTGLLSRMPGQTFGSIRERRGSDPEARAALSFGDLAFCLVRWIVDIYHNTPHIGLGGETPLNCWRRLTKEWGIQPPPDRDTQRAIFGERLKRRLSREGVLVLGMRYHSEELAQWLLHKEERDVEVRWHQDNIGAVTVHVGSRKFTVGAVHPGFDGVSARQWIAGIRAARASDPRQRYCERQVVVDANAAIEARSTAATRLAGLLVDDWSPERILREEERLFIGFGVVADRPMQPVAGDGIGRTVPDADVGTAGDREDISPTKFASTRPALPHGEKDHAHYTSDTSPTSVASTWKITE
ncbi:Mu transposase C-terminal domain-containing protein [Paracoccus jeotgali]|nr:Mu transposase C-terminal domain-containing protein [Paracoccus jeotgali]